MAAQRELVEQVFEAALALGPMEREAFLEDVCGGDLKLKRTVADLLAEDERAGSFLGHPPFDVLGEAAGGFRSADEEIHSNPDCAWHRGTRRWRLVLVAATEKRPPYRHRQDQWTHRSGAG